LFGAIKAVEEFGNIGKTLIISCFYCKEIAEYIKKGIVYAAISHDPFGQGHDPIIYLYNMLITGKKPENEVNWSRIEIIDKKNTYELL
jgi:methyl-accepting chemotaxis protein/ribose transport system substrate-binding protein